TCVLSLVSYVTFSHLFCFMSSVSMFVFLTAPATTETYTLSLHDALPIYSKNPIIFSHSNPRALRDHPRNIPDELMKACAARGGRSEEHTSELQSRENLVCRLLLEKKKNLSDMQTNHWQRTQISKQGMSNY